MRSALLRSFVLLFALPVSLSAQESKPRPTEADLQAEVARIAAARERALARSQGLVREVVQADLDFASAARTGSLADAFADRFLADGKMFPDGEPVVVGPEAVRQRMAQSRAEWHWSPEEAKADGRLGVTWGIASILVRGEQPAIYRTRYVTVWQKDDSGTWKIWIDLGTAGDGLFDGPPAPGPTTDHHVHLLGPGLIRDWKSLGVSFSRPDATYLSPEGLFQGSPTLPAVERVVLVPMAHLYGNSEFREGLKLSLEEERRRAAAENDHVTREAGRYPGRAVALCSVSVLRPWAWEELRRCRTELGSAGLKLHLASSEVDLREPEHLRRVAEIAAWAESERLPILLHVDTQRRGTTTEHVTRFARTVLEPHPRLTVVVAHLGGSGGYGPWTRSVFRSLSDWLEERRAAGDPRAVFFDLSAVLLERESEGVPASTPEDTAELARDIRRAGFDRLLLGSDYPVFDPRRTLELLTERLGLTPEEVAQLRTRRLAAWFPD